MKFVQNLTRLIKYRDQLPEECYELDQPSTQNLKRKAYTDAGIDVDWIHFVPVNFTHESWSEKLLGSGFDPTQRTFWLWEGVTLYLEKSIIVNTFNEIEELLLLGRDQGNAFAGIVKVVRR